MKAWITKDEWYPVATLEEQGRGQQVDLPDAIVAEYQELTKHFREFNDYLLQKYDEAIEAEKLRHPSPPQSDTDKLTVKVWNQAMITNEQHRQAREHCHALMTQYTNNPMFRAFKPGDRIIIKDIPAEHTLQLGEIEEALYGKLECDNEDTD